MTPTLKLHSLTFKAGANASSGPLRVELPTVTIIVGPNNSGKSLALKEIEQWCAEGVAPSKILDAIEINWPISETEVRALFEPFRADPPPNNATSPGHIWVKYPNGMSPNFSHTQIHIDSVALDIAKQSIPNLPALLRMYALRLDGRTRFALVEPRDKGDLLGKPDNHLAALWLDPSRRDQVRQLTEEAFGLHFVMENLKGSELRPRLSPRKPESEAEEQSLDTKAREFHGEALQMTEVSDGVQAFTGLVAAVSSLPHRIILVDEPEAFLHPPLARRLGKNLANLAGARASSIVMSTHSSDILMGCLESGTPLRILRLTRDNNSSTARTIEPASLTLLMRDPLLRSTQLLRALFHKSAVVTEADKDRAFYDEVNYRLQAEKRGIDDCLFANAQNWQTIPRIVGALRRVGIPAAAIMDIDVLLQSPKEWVPIWDMLAMTDDRVRLEGERQAVCQILKELPGETEKDRRKNLKQQGLESLESSRRAVAFSFLNSLAERGLFIVPVGEVENWLAMHGVEKEPKNTWLPRMFEAMKADPLDSAYISAAQDDVWTFVEKIAAWIKDPGRSGSAA